MAVSYKQLHFISFEVMINWDQPAWNTTNNKDMIDRDRILA